MIIPTRPHPGTRAEGFAAAPPSPAARFAPYIPYCATLLGLYALHNVWVALLGYHLGMLLMLTLDKQWPQARLLGRGGSSWQLVAAVVGGLGVGLLCYLCWPWFQDPGVLSARLAQLGLTRASWPYFLGYFILINPWVEELSWRAHLGTPARTPRLNDLLFAGYHLLVMAHFVRWPWLLLALLALTGAAWAWRQIARVNHGLLIPLVSHACADAGIVLTAFLFSLR